MTDTDTSSTNSLTERVERLEQGLAGNRVSDVFARFYGPLAVAALVMSFLPPFEEVQDKLAGSGTVRTTYGTLWEMAARGGPATLAVLVVLVLVTLLVVATVPVSDSRGLPVGIAACAGVLILMLILRPGTGEPTPGLTDAGVAELVVLVCCTVVAVVHAFQRRGGKSSV
ncbi:hypothetical protein FHX37_1592 [Haloactinospora alba]|uniref:Uncharacterized protein n=1 Tax=Haloactinospora alba TaxID=405555 RepID=A0A543NIK6_9ACTN|nr:hypothetical protein [Haloactinospora alba]TQN31673.1 hypothetical protein FHX37_1592 [Haloactinospora alba]